MSEKPIEAPKQKFPTFQDNLQFSSYMITPDSSQTFPELNKDIAISDLSAKWQKVILIKSRIAHYLNQTFANTPALIGRDEEGNPEFQKDEKGNMIALQSGTAMAFVRDVMGVAVTSQAMKARLLRQITENKQQVSHNYAMDKQYKKNIGE